MTTPVIIDAVAVAILAFFVLWGAHQGLLRSLAGLLTIVVALVQGNEVTVKSFFPKTGGRVELRPANPEYDVQIYPAEEVSIQGRVIGLQRKY